eukprot:4987225-Pleurochrysis_carterae.AAC.1
MPRASARAREAAWRLRAACVAAGRWSGGAAPSLRARRRARRAARERAGDGHREWREGGTRGTRARAEAPLPLQRARAAQHRMTLKWSLRPLSLLVAVWAFSSHGLAAATLSP